MNIHQQQTLQIVTQILSERKYRSNDRTMELLQSRGFYPVWKRVTWKGGVGSWKEMRNHKVRVVICATVSGVTRSKAIVRGLTALFKGRKRRGYKYAWCVEI